MGACGSLGLCPPLIVATTDHRGTASPGAEAHNASDDSGVRSRGVHVRWRSAGTIAYSGSMLMLFPMEQSPEKEYNDLGRSKPTPPRLHGLAKASTSVSGMRRRSDLQGGNEAEQHIARLDL
jgi:hypothetical protein